MSVAADASSSVTNTAVVAGGGEANAANDPAADSTTILSAVDLVVANTHSGRISGMAVSLSYVLTVTNIGGASTAGVVTVVDSLPVGLTATAIAGAGWTCTLSTVTCTRSDVLTGGASYSALTVTVNVANNAPATVTNSATVSGGGDTNASNSTASDPTSIVQLPDLTLSLVHGGTFTQGQTGATYVLSVTNVGASPTSGVVTVTDTLPSGLARTGLAGNGWSCVLASLTCTRSDQLAAGASYPSITLTADISMTAPASVTNTAVVSGGGDSASTNNSASDVTTIVQLADLTVSVAHSGAFSRGQSGAIRDHSRTAAAPTAGTVTNSDALPAGCDSDRPEWSRLDLHAGHSPAYEAIRSVGPGLSNDHADGRRGVKCRVCGSEHGNRGRWRRGQYRYPQHRIPR